MGHLGVGGASGEASEARLGGVLEPSWGLLGASMGSSWGCFEAPGGLPGVILLDQSAIFRVKCRSVVAFHLGCH